MTQHMGYIKRIAEFADSGHEVNKTNTSLLSILVAASMAVGPAWEHARLLMYSGSEHPPLISQLLSDWMVLHGPPAGGVTQANGDYLLLYEVGKLHLGLNGKPVTQNFLLTQLSPYDIMLG